MIMIDIDAAWREISSTTDLVDLYFGSRFILYLECIILVDATYNSDFLPVTAAAIFKYDIFSKHVVVVAKVLVSSISAIIILSSFLGTTR